jgi:hypothetical protein
MFRMMSELGNVPKWAIQNYIILLIAVTQQLDTNGHKNQEWRFLNQALMVHTIILAIQEAEIRRFVIQSQPRQIV